jgi:hypothetical protein
MRSLDTAIDYDAKNSLASRHRLGFAIDLADDLDELYGRLQELIEAAQLPGTDRIAMGAPSGRKQFGSPKPMSTKSDHGGSD